MLAKGDIEGWGDINCTGGEAGIMRGSAGQENCRKVVLHYHTVSISGMHN